MDKKEQDKKIEEFLDNLSENYNFSQEDISYLSQYSGCDMPIPDNVISKLKEMVMKRMPSIFDETLVNFPSMKPKHILAVGYMADKVLQGNYATVTAFQGDYYCYMASKGIQQERINNGSYRLNFRNLADYFTNYKGNNIKYSAVVCMPVKTAYHRMDVDTNLAFLDPYVYYVARSVLFTREGGVVFAVIPEESLNKLEEIFQASGWYIKDSQKLSGYALVQIEEKPTEHQKIN